MDELAQIIKELEKRIEALERKAELTKITIPSDGKLVVDSQASDPTAENGRIYYNTTTNTFKVCRNNTWYTISTS